MRVEEIIGKIAERVPLFGEYYRKEAIREMERELREKVVSEIEAFERKLMELAKGKPFSELGKINEISKRILHLKDSIRYAPYGYTGFFAKKGTGEEELEKLLEKDLELLNWACGLHELEKLEEMEEAIERGWKILDERKGVIHGSIS